MSTRIPVVDLTDADSPAARTRVAEAIRLACRDTGFLYVTGHGIDARLVDAAFAASARFFEQPESAKQALFHKNSRSLAGWEPLCAQSLDGESAPDLKESYYCSFDLPDDHPLVVAGYRSFGANQWPAALPGFRAAMLDYLAAVTALGHRMLGHFAESLGLARDHFAPMFVDASCHLRAVRYPPHPADAPPDQLGAGTHTDWGALTLLMQDGSGGLRVQTVAGEWIDATPIPGAFVVNIGDLMARWTNDVYRSSPHHVRNDRTGRPRQSLAFFFAPNPHARIECLPSCGGADRPARYAPCTASEHMMEMVARTYGKGRAVAA